MTMRIEKVAAGGKRKRITNGKVIQNLDPHTLALFLYQRGADFESMSIEDVEDWLHDRADIDGWAANLDDWEQAYIEYINTPPSLMQRFVAWVTRREVV